MTEQKVSFRYAKAVLETAAKEGLAETLFNDFLAVESIVNSSRELRTMIANPIFQLWRKKKIFEELFGSNKISPLAYNFLHLLIEKRRAVLILDIIKQYQLQYYKMNKMLPVTIVTSLELTDVLRESVLARISSITGMKIVPTFEVDPQIKGGMKVIIDDWVFDASIKNQLANLFKSLSEGLN